MTPWRPTPFARQVAIVVACVALATLLRLALEQALPERGVFLPTLIAIAVAAHTGGLWCGIATTVLGFTVAYAMFMPEAGTAAGAPALQVVLSLAIAIPVCVLGGRMHSLLGALEEALQRERRLLDSERAARVEADRAVRFKDEFLAVLSHELRTPLSAVMGWAHVLKNLELPKDGERAVEAILRSVSHQEKLMTDISDLSRVATGKLALGSAAVDVGRTLEESVEMVRLAALGRSVRLELGLPAEPLFVRGDASRLQQVFANVLSNAIKFSPEGESVRIAAARRDGEIEVSVADKGRGISPEFLPHVFDTFRQEDPSKSRRHGGLGLGLAIARHLVEAHGGRVVAASDGTGRGSTFTLSFPVLAGAPAAAGSDELAQPAALRGLRVLVVEDDPDALAVMTRCLADLGANVVPTASAAQARGALASERPDVIVSDIGMPGEDGLAFMRSLRERDDCRNIPAIAMTAYASSADRTDALNAGFQLHLPKPVEPNKLAHAIAQLRTPS